MGSGSCFDDTVLDELGELTGPGHVDAPGRHVHRPELGMYRTPETLGIGGNGHDFGQGLGAPGGEEGG